MIRKALTIIALIWSNTCPGQAGYIGKINEVSVDAFSAAYVQHFNFTYKISPFQNASFYANFGMCSASHEIPIEHAMSLQVVDLVNTNYNFGSNTSSIAEGDLKSAKISAKVTNFGFGILYNSSANNMQMPIGYYSGIGFHVMSGTDIAYYELKTPLPAGYTTSIPYHLSERSIRMMFGKNTVLASNVTLDLALSAGYSWGSLTLNETTLQGITENSPYSQYPTAAPVFWSREFTPESDYGTTGNLNTTKFTFGGLYLMPNIRIGYIF